MLEFLVGYFIGKGARKNKVELVEEPMDIYSISVNSSPQEFRSFEELLDQARENARAKDHQ